MLAGYILAVMLHLCTQDGMIYELFPYVLTQQRITLVCIANEATVLLLFAMVLEFIPFRMKSPRLYNAAVTVIMTSIGQFFIGFLLPNYLQLTLCNYQMLSAPILLMLLILFQWSKTGRVERIFFLSFIAFLLSQGVYTLTVLGWIQYTWTEWYVPMQTGTVAQAIILSFATSMKVNTLRQEREDALQKAKQSELYRLQSEELRRSNEELDRAMQNLKETQTQLVASERLSAVGMLTAGMMHEINNPNAAVYAALEEANIKNKQLRVFFLSLLDDESKSSAEAQKFEQISTNIEKTLALAMEGSSRVKNIVASLRTFTKHQEYGVKSSILATEILSTIEIFKLQYSNVHVILNFIGDTTIEANFGEINQVFLNLLVNAAQAGASEITIASQRTNTGCTVTVSDNGSGIPSQTLSHIFEPFFTSKGIGNSGLGLSISKNIIEQHGATLNVSSELGFGTTFTLHFIK